MNNGLIIYHWLCDRYMQMPVSVYLISRFSAHMSYLQQLRHANFSSDIVVYTSLLEYVAFVFICMKDFLSNIFLRKTACSFHANSFI